MRNFRIGDRRDIDDFGDPDDTTFIFDMVSHVRDEGNGFPILSFTLGLPGKKQYKCIIYINKDAHPNNHGGRVTITNAELAAQFFLGNWSGWFETTILPALRGIAADTQYRIEKQASEQAKRLRQEYNRSIREWKKSRAFGRFIISMMSKTGLGPIVNTFDEKMNPISIPIADFVKMTKLHTKSRGWTEQMEAELVGAKREAWVQNILPRVRRIEESDPILTQLIIDPFKYGAFIEGAIRAGAKNAAEKVSELIRGSKHPDISERTKANRRSRGNADGPPLFETGDFADSVEYDII